MKLLDNPLGRNTDGRYEEGGLLLLVPKKSNSHVQQTVAQTA